jgi:hypothetical protein
VLIYRSDFLSNEEGGVGIIIEVTLVLDNRNIFPRFGKATGGDSVN